VIKGADLSVLIFEHPAIMKRLAAVLVRRLAAATAAVRVG
jgi:CRP-like cAMP-binding protein